jgi:hypothetical protein
VIKFLCSIAVMCSISGHVFAQDLIKKCMPASFGYAKSTARESIADDFGDYFEYGGVKYGESTKGEGYIGVDDERVMLAAISFRDPKGKMVSLGSDDLALSRAVAYGSKSDRFVVCILSPFSGIGSSGGYQRYVGLIAVGKPHGRLPLRTEGAIVRSK